MNHYAHPVDVLRKFDPTLSVADIEGGELGPSGMAFLRSSIEAAESEFESDTGHALREVAVGHEGAPETFEYHEAKLRRYQGGVKLWLDHRHVMPIDPAKGDRLEVRTGRDSWREITTMTNLWRLNPVDGMLQLMGLYRFGNATWRHAVMEDNVRVRYRYGGLGGGRDRGGQTELSTDVADTGASITVEEPARLPRDSTVLVGGEEYVGYRSIDPDTGELQDLQRGRHGTDPANLSAGDPVNYVPKKAREGVAAAAAIELARNDDHLDRLAGGSESMDLRSKIDGWRSEWERTKAKYSEARLA